MSEAQTATNGPAKARFIDRLGEYTEIRFQQMRWASKAAKCLDAHEREGGDRDDIRDGFTLGKLSPDERKAEIRRQMRVASYMGVTTWQETGQASFIATFDQPPEELDTLGAGGAPIGSRLSLARAHVDGYNTGKAGGEVSVCPFPAESEEATSWETGWQDGREDRPEPKPSKQAHAASNGDGEPKRRGRRPKQKDEAPPPNEATPEPPPPLH
jgi:ribosome modulation factor